MKLMTTLAAAATVAALVVPAFAQTSTMHHDLMKKPMMHSKMTKKQMMMHKKMMMKHDAMMKHDMMKK